jgi:vacuolar-type H+-ATPase subunit H
MASSGKQKTTTSKRIREAKLRERRIEKQAKKDARKLAASDRADTLADPTESPAPDSWD